MCIPTNGLSKEHQQVCSSTMKHPSMGSAVNVISDLVGHTISNDIKCLPKLKTNAEDIINFLQFRSTPKKGMQFEALYLYHLVDQSSLLAIEMAKQRRARVDAFQEKNVEELVDNKIADDVSVSDGEPEMNLNEDLLLLLSEIRANNNESIYWEPIHPKWKRKPNREYIVDENNLQETLQDSTFSLEDTSFDGNGTTEKTTPVEVKKNSDKLTLGDVLVSVSKTHELKIDQKNLFAVAWCRNDERRLFEMFSEILLFDVTHKTNNEKRPLGIFAGIDQNMEAFTPLRIFMPSECQWVLYWIFASACPALLGTEPLQ